MGTKIVNGVLVDSDTPSKFVGESASLVAVPGSPVTFTQTYSTTTDTQTAPTAAALVLTATAIAAKTASLTLTDSDVASLAAMKVTNDQLAKDIGTAINKNTADTLVLAKLVAQIIDVLQSAGLSL